MRVTSVNVVTSIMPDKIDLFVNDILIKTAYRSQGDAVLHELNNANSLAQQALHEGAPLADLLAKIQKT